MAQSLCYSLETTSTLLIDCTPIQNVSGLKNNKNFKSKIKWITSKDLLYNTENSAQCYVTGWIGGEFGGEWIHVYVWLSPFAVH